MKITLFGSRSRYIWLFCIAVGDLMGLSDNSLAQSLDCRVVTPVSNETTCYHDKLSSLKTIYVATFPTVVKRGGSVAGTAEGIAARQMASHRECASDGYCSNDVFTDASTSLDVVIGAYGKELRSYEIKSPKPHLLISLEELSVDELICLWFRTNHSCRGGSTLAAIESCSIRTEIGDYLSRIRGWCYGQEDEAGIDYEWHECGTTSLGFREGRP